MKDMMSEVTKFETVFHWRWDDYIAAMTSTNKAPNRARKSRGVREAEAMDAEQERICP